MMNAYMEGGQIKKIIFYTYFV